MPKVDICVVAYEPEREGFLELLRSLIEEPISGPDWSLRILDNTARAETMEQLRQWCEAVLPAGRFAAVDIVAAARNLGFGSGVNTIAAQGTSPYLLLLNPDVVVEPGAIAGMLACAEQDAPQVAAWEFRQIPYEHPKAYDPASLDSPWFSAAAVLLRRDAFESVKGFEPKLFMYGEDVDLSWRLRAAGWRLRYIPRHAVVHRSYAYPEQVKRAQVLGGTLSNLCLRARFGTWRDVGLGVGMLLAEAALPQQAFPGRRVGLVANLFRFAAKLPYFRGTRVRASERFSPVFSGWGFELRRDGAFHAFKSRRVSQGDAVPKVSILIRTIGRHAWLREALASVMHQTYPGVEAVVVEDGPATSEAMIRDEFAPRMNIKYLATGQRVGRARCGNIALSEAEGEWLNFLDDDDVLFADHVEVLVDAVRSGGARGAYALAWETHTRVIDQQQALYEETMHLTRHHQPFDRITLWHHNYLPIQAVLFHRSLYEKHGGFAEDLDQLEDWNLWTRYTLEDDFVLVGKTTSKYRVPADLKASGERQGALDKAYAAALRKQEAMQMVTNPRSISAMVETYARGQSLLMITRNDVRRFFTLNGTLGRLARYRSALTRRLRNGGAR